MLARTELPPDAFLPVPLELGVLDTDAVPADTFRTAFFMPVPLAETVRDATLLIIAPDAETTRAAARTCLKKACFVVIFGGGEPGRSELGIARLAGPGVYPMPRPRWPYCPGAALGASHETVNAGLL